MGKRRVGGDVGDEALQDVTKVHPKKEKTKSARAAKTSLLELGTAELIEEHAIEDAEETTSSSSIPLPPHGTLAMRLGKFPVSKDSCSPASYKLALGFLSRLQVGDLDSQIPLFEAQMMESVQVQSLEISVLLNPKLSAKKVDEKFAALYCSPSKDGTAAAQPPRIPVKVVDGLLDRIGSEPGFFPKLAFSTLLEHNYVSDWAHGQVVAPLLQSGDMELVQRYIKQVPDTQESTVVNIIKFIMSSEQVKFKEIPGFASKDAAILAVLSWRMSVDAVKYCLTGWDVEQLEYLLELLERILKLYALTHAEELLLGEAGKGDENLLAPIPSRANTLKWLEALLDSNYVSILMHTSLLQRLKSISKTISSESVITEKLLDFKAACSTMAYKSGKSLRKYKKFPTTPQAPYSSSQYTAEVASF